MVTKKLITTLVLGGLCFLMGIGFVAGCSSVEPYEYENEADEIKPGPGLFTGEDGEAVIFHIPAEPQNQPANDQTQEITKEAPEAERIIQPEEAQAKDANTAAPESERMIQP